MGAFANYFIYGAPTKVAKGLFGSGTRRMLTGAAIGGIYSAATTDNLSPTGSFKDTVFGATIGGAIGGSTIKGVRGLLANSAFKTGWGGAKLGANTATKVTGAALRNPKLALMAGGVGLGAYALASSGPGSSGMSTRAMSTIAARNNIPSTGFMPGQGAMSQQQSRSMFMNSTFGLTESLHNRRHG